MSHIKQLEALVRDIIRFHGGYDRLLLDKNMTNQAVGHALDARRTVIAEIMRQAGIDYASVFERLLKVLRKYEMINIAAQKTRTTTRWLACCVCGKPVLARLPHHNVHCRYHRRMRKLVNITKNHE